jgi:Flp pilus assembly protein TadB
MVTPESGRFGIEGALSATETGVLMKKLAVLILAALFAFGATGAVYSADAWAKSSKSSGSNQKAKKKTASKKKKKKKKAGAKKKTAAKEYRRNGSRPA